MSLEKAIKAHFKPLIFNELDSYITTKTKRYTLLEVYYVSNALYTKGCFYSINLHEHTYHEDIRTSKGKADAMLGNLCISKQSILEILQEYLEEKYVEDTYNGEGSPKKAEIIRKSVKRYVDNEVAKK